MSDGGGSMYTGLSERARLLILGLGAVIAAMNLGVAWWLADGAMSALHLTHADVDNYKSLVNVADRNFTPASRQVVAERTLNVVTLTKLISNKQGLVLACYGGAFAMAAIGFALFVIGADGAFKVSAGGTHQAGVVLSGTAPGLLCFVLAGWLLGKGVDHTTTVTLPGIGEAPRTAEPAQECYRRLGDRCFSEAEWKEQMKQGQTQPAKP
jgi:hypothetical protein